MHTTTLGRDVVFGLDMAELDMGEPRLGLCNDIGKDPASDQGYLVFQHQLAFLQPLQLQLVEWRAIGQPFDDIVKIAMLALQRMKAGMKLLLFLNFGVAHRRCFPLWRIILIVIRLAVCQSPSCPTRRLAIKPPGQRG
tara:strand:- start:1333 stop:1746 length:414 start_codon:yes stop_codon:yes gene_type:complete